MRVSSCPKFLYSPRQRQSSPATRRVAKSLARREASEAAEGNSLVAADLAVCFVAGVHFFPVPASKKPDDRQCNVGDRVVKTDP